MLNSLNVLTAVWGGLCCLDIGFRHKVPPRPGTMINMVTAGYSCLVFFVADESSSKGHLLELSIKRLGSDHTLLIHFI